MKEHGELQDITLPSFGSSIGESTLLRWLVTAGSEVSAGQVIAEIETDKAIAELEAPEAGVIESIEVAEGSDGVMIGMVLARLRVSGSKDATGTGASIGNVETAHRSTKAVSSSGEREMTASAATTPATDVRGRVTASPFARKLATERKVPLRGITGSGPGGRIVSRDLDQARASVPASASLPLDALGYPADSYSLKPLTKMRQAIADGLARSVREIPSYSLTSDIDLGLALDHRRRLNDTLDGDAAKISINDVIVRASARALVEVPDANSSWTEDGIVLHRHANIALAVAIDEGLVAPVLRSVETMTLREIAEMSAKAIRRARDRQLTPAELQGATMTISNLGMLGISSFTSILSRPQACILSLGAVEQRAIVRDGKLAIATLATFTLTCDHRVVDGAIGAMFLKRLGEYLGSPSD
jgi:pyruvate dehydrogenase E2 component (dihydrolipoamide acetyltransferase)